MKKILLHIVTFLLLTILTQVGGVIYLLSNFISKKINFKKKYFKYFTFPVLYLLLTFSLVPQLAKLNGRESLSFFTSPSLKPVTIWTCILNRHYVNKELKKAIVDSRYELGTMFYLDANFPLFDGFPLLPHWSHNDGKKLDLAFVYKDDKGKYGSNPSFIGYGICEEPKKGESNFPRECAKQGYFQYNILKSLIPQGSKKDYTLDENKTKLLINNLSQIPSIKKIFIEPHLKTRWGFANNSKVRFHGCHAVRHDDHIHIQL